MAYESLRHVSGEKFAAELQPAYLHNLEEFVVTPGTHVVMEATSLTESNRKRYYLFEPVSDRTLAEAEGIMYQVRPDGYGQGAKVRNFRFSVERVQDARLETEGDEVRWHERGPVYIDQRRHTVNAIGTVGCMLAGRPDYFEALQNLYWQERARSTHVMKDDRKDKNARTDIVRSPYL